MFAIKMQKYQTNLRNLLLEKDITILEKLEIMNQVSLLKYYKLSCGKGRKMINTLYKCMSTLK